MMSINIGTPKNQFGTKGKLMVFGVPILKDFRVIWISYSNLKLVSTHRNLENTQFRINRYLHNAIFLKMT